MGLGVGVGAAGQSLGSPCRRGEGESLASGASMPVGSLALLLSPLAGASDLGLRMARKLVEALRGRGGLLGEGLKRFYNIIWCQIGKDSLSPPPFPS